MQNDIMATEMTDVGIMAGEMENQAETIIQVPLDTLAKSHGVVASDVRTSKGAVILPAGVDISLFATSMKTIINKMVAEGIKYVPLYVTQQISETDINEIIEKVYSDGAEFISKEKAVSVIKGVGNMFNTIRDGDMTTEITNQISNMSFDLAEDLLKNPKVAFSLGKVQEADEYTFVHSFNVAVLTGYLTRRLHPADKDYLQRIIMGGLLHDMGKARIPVEILNKPGPLTPPEFEIMKKHPNYGVAMALKTGVKDPVIISVIGGHHEKWSGKGYPKGSNGQDIPEAARISAVADVFDALTAKRVYKSSMSSRNALSVVLKDSGAHFDTRIVRELLLGLGLYPPGSIVALSDGRTGFVVSGGGKDLIRPVILLKKEKEDDAPVFVDLKNERGICIAQYMGHSEKRDLGYKLE